MAVNATWARNSAVTSTTVEAVASDQETPCSVTARAPNTKPPTCENGRQLAEASRTMRPQISTQQAAELAAGRDRVPGQAQNGEQRKLPADDHGELAPADAADAGQHAAKAEPADQDRAEQQARQGEDDRKLSHRMT